MARLIDADALGIGRCNPDAFPLQNRGYCAGWNGVIQLIKEAPTVDAVPVVRCKDCKYRKKRVCANPTAGMWVGVELKENDYCSYGERKNDGC